MSAKVLKMAIKNSIQDINLDNLIEVLEATGNSMVATEIMLGIYDMPNIPLVTTSRNRKRTFKSYNKFANVVEFDYEEERSQTCFFRTKEEMENTVEYSSKMKIYVSSSEEELYPFKKQLSYTYTGSSSCNLAEWEQ